MKFACLILIALLIFLPACSQLPGAGGTAQPDVLPTASRTADATATRQVDAATPSAAAPPILRLWVPPQFDPTAQTPEAALFQGRLNEFSKNHPGVRVEVRVKALDGPGGLLDALTTAGAAAPAALPDLIALPRPLLEPAALKGLLQPYPGQIEMEASNWYPYAQELARLQDTVYGLPFAGDALAMVSHPDEIPTAPQNWQAVQQLETPMVFPAADPQALVTLAAYQAAGGDAVNEQGQPALDALALTEVLTY
jgi:ABC-type glycerol-3-phosphate transport system substrate-binding protein